MIELEVTPTSLVVQVRGKDRVLAIICGLALGARGRLEISLAHVKEASTTVPEVNRFWRGWTVAAFSWPYSLTMGRMFHALGKQRGELSLWAVHHPDKAIAIQLHDERYNRLVVEVVDPEGAVAKITQALLQGGR